VVAVAENPTLKHEVNVIPQNVWGNVVRLNRDVKHAKTMINETGTPSVSAASSSINYASCDINAILHMTEMSATHRINWA